MSPVRIVPARDRMDRVEFSHEQEWRDHAVQMGAYQCPGCSHRVELRASDIERHEYAPTTNLRDPWPRRFDDARPVRGDRWESFLDFNCPGCGAPVRLIFAQGPEYAMGAHSWSFVDIVEVAEWVPEA